MKIYRWIFFLSLFGVLLSGYALYAHYNQNPSTICNFSDALSCDAVNKSKYAEIAGVPVALVGLGGYGLLAVLAIQIVNGRPFHRDLFWFALAGFLFSLYLTYVEAFVILAWCPVCLLSQAAILGIVVLSSFGVRAHPKEQIPDKSQ